MEEPKKPMTPFEDLQGLLEWVLSTDIVEFSLERGEEKVSLKRAYGQGSSDEALKVKPSMKEPSVPQQALIPPPQEKPPLAIISAPMVGTFYRAPAPEAGPYIEVGDTVRKGQVVCIIEAMKIMNEIESDVTGKVLRVLVENGKPVGFGTPLFELEPLQL